MAIKNVKECEEPTGQFNTDLFYHLASVLHTSCKLYNNSQVLIPPK